MKFCSICTETFDKSSLTSFTLDEMQAALAFYKKLPLITTVGDKKKYYICEKDLKLYSMRGFKMTKPPSDVKACCLCGTYQNFWYGKSRWIVHYVLQEWCHTACLNNLRSE